MNGLNWNRIVIGGIAAAVVALLTEIVSFGVLFNAQANAAMAGIGKDFESGGLGAMALFIAYALVIGLTTAWLYAAIRARYGAGPRTGVTAGIAVWMLVFLTANLTYLSADMFPASFVGLSLAVGLVESLAAALVAGYLYRE